MITTRQWQSERGVLVVGSGAAALVAAITAHDHGAQVRVVERSDLIGGITAVSGGGMWQTRIRRGHVFSAPALVGEFTQWLALLRPENGPADVISERLDRGPAATGNALVGMLNKGCLDRGISVELEARVIELIQDDGRLSGVYAEREGKPVQLGALAVVLACGGFEWNNRLKNAFLPGRIDCPNSPLANEGAALLMAMEVGADLDNMTQTWGFPSMLIPNERYEGRQLSRLSFAEGHAPHSMIVNRRGQRFANEVSNYNDVPKPFQNFDSAEFGFLNARAWAIVDSQYRERYTVATTVPGAPNPEWLDRDTSLKGLGTKVGIDPEGLEPGVARFNYLCGKGRDTDLGTGDDAYDQFMGDKSARHLALGAIEKPPFYAAPIVAGTTGTKGGPRVNKDGRVLYVRERARPLRCRKLRRSNVLSCQLGEVAAPSDRLLSTAGWPAATRQAAPVGGSTLRDSSGVAEAPDLHLCVPTPRWATMSSSTSEPLCPPSRTTDVRTDCWQAPSADPAGGP